MDLWIYKQPKLEREYQQVILRDNNLSGIANDTDYYIVYIEYASSENGSRFDMIGVKWLSNAVSRRNRKSPSLAFIELKYGDGTMNGSAGIAKHFADMEKFIMSGKVEPLMLEAQTQFNQMVQLGLVNKIVCSIEIDTKARPEFIIVCANHKPASTILARELKLACEKYPYLQEMVDIKIATASYMGYGLYAEKMLGINEFIMSMGVLE